MTASTPGDVFGQTASSACATILVYEAKFPIRDSVHISGDEIRGSSSFDFVATISLL
jgi:hypothetical protein